MADGNGSPVTYREFRDALGRIESEVREVRVDITEIRGDMKAFRIMAENRAFLGARGRAVASGLMISVPAALVAWVVSYVAH